MRADLAQAAELLHQGGPVRVDQALRLLQRTVLSFSMNLCRHREDAEDTMQEVLLASLPHLAKLGDAKALSVWLYVAARHRCSRSRRQLSYRNAVALDGVPLHATAPEPSPEAEAARQESRQFLQQALAQLPQHDQALLALHDLQEIETSEIAATLGLRPATVRVQLHRARQRLRRLMTTPSPLQ